MWILRFFKQRQEIADIRERVRELEEQLSLSLAIIAALEANKAALTQKIIDLAGIRPPAD